MLPYLVLVAFSIRPVYCQYTVSILPEYCQHTVNTPKTTVQQHIQSTVRNGTLNQAGFISKKNAFHTNFSQNNKTTPTDLSYFPLKLSLSFSGLVSSWQVPLILLYP